MSRDKNYVWIVGNSQLCSSLLQAFCPAEVFQQCSADWENHRVSKGEFRFEEQVFKFLFCNMSLLGDPTFDGKTLNASDNMFNFVQSVDAYPTSVVVMLRGNEFAIESLVDYPVRWDFSYNGMSATQGRQFVRSCDIKNYFKMRTNSLFASCLIYRINFPNTPIYHVVAPPPIESEDHIRSSPEGFGALFEEFGVRPFHLRKKIYDMMYDVLVNDLNKIGVKSIFAPQEALTDSGGLRSEFASGCLHGNGNFGIALMSLLKRSDVYASV